MTLRVLAETAKLDGFAYWRTHAVCMAACSGGGSALSVPGHLVQTPTADLLQSFAAVINQRHRSPSPPTHTCKTTRDAIFCLRHGEISHPFLNFSAICRIRCSFAVHNTLSVFGIRGALVTKMHPWILGSPKLYVKFVK